MPLSLGCDASVTGPDDLLSVRLAVTPVTVAPGDSLIARLTLVNDTRLPVALGSPNGCLALPEVHQDGSPVRVEGTGLLCSAAFTTHVVPARDSLVREFRLRAAVDADLGVGAPHTDLPTGVYDLRMDFQVSLTDPVTVFTVGPA